jgi:hypothetical protein
MDFNALKPGKIYKMNDEGNLVEAEEAPQNLTPVAEDDLPPDMRPGAKEAEQKIEELTDNVKKLSETLSNPPKQEEPTLVISEDEKIAFMKSVISNRPYKKQFTAFGGGVKFTFKTLSTSELDAVSEALVIQSSRIPYSTMLAMAGAHMRFCLASSLCEIEYHGDDGIRKEGYLPISELYPESARKDTFYVKDQAKALQKKEMNVIATPGQKVIWAATEKFDNMSVPLYNILFEKYQRFDAEVLQMARETSDPAFFPNGAGGPY